MSFVLQRSPGGTHVRNFGGTKNVPPPTYCTYAGLLGFWPICGMGTWNSNASPTNYVPGSGGLNPDSMDELWPNVYRTLTVIWQQDTGPTQTTVYQYQDYCDVPVTATTTTDPSWVPPNGYTGAIAFSNPDGAGGYTTFSQAYSYPPAPGRPGGTGTFTATLSNQWIAYDAATNTDHWADKTGLALALIAGQMPGAPTAAMETLAYYPVTTGTGSASLDAGYVCAAARGFPTRDSSFPPAFGFYSVVPDLPSIMDFDEPGGGIYPNQGGVICVASTWMLTGVAPNVIYPTPTNHKTIYAQEFILPKFAMGPIIEPWPEFMASGVEYRNPLTFVPIQLTFLPSDVPHNFDEYPAPEYGLIGFHNNWAAGVDGNGNPYPGAGPTYIGAGPATGGAGGVGPQPGTGGGPPPV